MARPVAATKVENSAGRALSAFSGQLLENFGGTGGAGKPRHSVSYYVNFAVAEPIPGSRHGGFKRGGQAWRRMQPQDGGCEPGFSPTGFEAE